MDSNEEELEKKEEGEEEEEEGSSHTSDDLLEEVLDDDVRRAVQQSVQVKAWKEDPDNVEGNTNYRDYIKLRSESRIEEALEKLKRGEELNHLPTQYEYALCFRGWFLCEEDDEKARRLMRKVAVQGYPAAMYELADMYVETNWVTRGVYWHAKAFQTGEPLTLAQLYYYGDYVNEDEERAFELFKIAADLELPESYYWMSQCFSHGNGVEKCGKTALQWALKGAMLGDDRSIVEVAEQYMNGVCGERNLHKSYEWLRKGAEQQNKDALFYLKEPRFKVYSQYGRVRESCFTLIAIRKFRKKECDYLGFLPIEIVVMMAKALWSTRKQACWGEEIPENLPDIRLLDEEGDEESSSNSNSSEGESED